MEFIDGNKYFKLARLQSMSNKDIVKLHDDLEARVRYGLELTGVFDEHDLPVIKEIMKDITYSQ